MKNWFKSLFRPKVTEWQKGWDYAENCFDNGPESIALWRIGHTELAQSAEWQRGVTDYINRRKTDVQRFGSSSELKYNKAFEIRH